MSPEPFVSRAKAALAMRSKKDYGDENVLSFPSEARARWLLFSGGWRNESCIRERDCNDVTIVNGLPLPESYSNTNLMQIDQWLLRFQIPPAQCGRKTFDAFSEWGRFQIPPAGCGRGGSDHATTPLRIQVVACRSRQYEWIVFRSIKDQWRDLE